MEHQGECRTKATCRGHGTSGRMQEERVMQRASAAWLRLYLLDTARVGRAQLILWVGARCRDGAKQCSNDPLS